MIDYEKLKQAVETCNKLNGSKLNVEFRIGDGEACFILYYFNKANSEDYVTYDIDTLLNKLTELTQPQRKYKIGDLVWFCNGSKEYGEVKILDYTREDTYHVISEDKHKFYSSECYLYPSLLHVINSQLTFWEQLKAVKKAEEFKKSNPSQHLLDASRYLNPHQGD